MPLFQTCSTKMFQTTIGPSHINMLTFLFHGVGKGLIKVPFHDEMERKSKGIVGEMGPEPVCSLSFSY